MTAIFKREFKAYFTTPVGWIVLAALYLLSGFFFWYAYSMGAPSIEFVFESMALPISVLVPVLTMRLMSDDRRQKVDQALLTAPVKLTSIVFGKFLASLAVFAIGLLPTVIYEIIFASHVSLNIFSYVYVLFGMLLLGSALIAVGMFISSLTESSAIAAMVSIVINVAMMFLPSLAGVMNNDWIVSAAEKVALLTYFSNFTQTVFSVPDVVYFISISAAFLFLCVRALDKRRWS